MPSGRSYLVDKEEGPVSEALFPCNADVITPASVKDLLKPRDTIIYPPPSPIPPEISRAAWDGAKVLRAGGGDFK